MNTYEDIKFSFLKAHEIIWKLGYWRYLLLPFILTLTLLPAMIAGLGFAAYFSADLIEGYLSKGEEAREWIKYLIFTLLILLGTGTGFVLYRNLVMVCYAPLLDRLSTQAEKLVTGTFAESNRPWIESLFRPLVITFYAVIASITTLIAGALTGLIPIIGAIIMLVLFIPTQLFLGAVGYIDPYLERKGMTPKASFELMWKHLIPVCIFSLTSLLLISVPLIGWFVGPTYTVVAGIVFGILLHESSIEQK